MDAPEPDDPSSASPRITPFVLGPFETNCYVVQVPAGESGERPCWIVDAGFDPDEMIRFIQSEGLKPVAAVLTHAHADHIAGLASVRRAFPGIPILIHEAEADWLGDPMLNLSAMGGIPITAPRADRLLADGERLYLGESEWEVRHTPGHSPGGIALIHEPSHQALVGDALFAGSVGRSDFPGSDPEVLARSIRSRLYTLPDRTRVFPGHGPPTTIGREKRSNPFVRGL